MRTKPSRLLARAVVGTLLLAGCTSGSEPVGMSAERTVVTLTEVSPANGALGVDPTAPVLLRFSHPMMVGMQRLILLHEGTISGGVVDGVGTWSADRTTLTFLAALPLRDRTNYVLHVAPGMMDVSGRPLELARAMSLGGMMADSAPSARAMMGNGSMMAGAMMGRASRTGPHSAGMLFAFTTR
ncbi:MAG: Ig-like domain-containing protein [Gemmatimonadaceae bacterium]|nr:Ig-like domain-containing protein [Gemmatimonadaceae bacterium]